LHSGFFVPLRGGSMRQGLKCCGIILAGFDWLRESLRIKIDTIPCNRSKRRKRINFLALLY
jgi:hypothetical protein